MVQHQDQPLLGVDFAKDDSGGEQLIYGVTMFLQATFWATKGCHHQEEVEQKFTKECKGTNHWEEYLVVQRPDKCLSIQASICCPIMEFHQ